MVYVPDFDVAMSGYSIPREQAVADTGNSVVARVERVKAQSDGRRYMPK
jgi:hypothetical protein